MTLAMKEKQIAGINFIKGKNEGRAEGTAKEKFNGMLKQIKTLKELNIPQNIIIEKVARDYEINESEIKKYL